MSSQIYLDCNATHPLLPTVREGLSAAILENSPSLANSSSIHRVGQRAKELVAQLRGALCEILGRPDGDEFILLSGATEAINLCVRGFCETKKDEGRVPVLVAPQTEHAAVLDTLKVLGEKFVETHTLSVNQGGCVDDAEVLSFVQTLLEDPSKDVLLCMQIANNETGVVPHVENLLEKIYQRFAPPPKAPRPTKKNNSQAVQQQRVWVLLDASQAVAKLEPSLLRRPLHYADYMCISAHKFGAPSGEGALWLRSGSPFKPQNTGGVQERKRRAGTLNSIGALGFYLALRDWLKNGDAYRAHFKKLREKLVLELKKIPGFVIHGLSKDGALPELSNTLNFHIEGCPEESLVLALDLKGYAVSSGSACNSGSLKPSHVLMAMGYSEEVALSSVRVSLGVETSEDEIKSFASTLQATVQHIREARVKSKALLGEV